MKNEIDKTHYCAGDLWDKDTGNCLIPDADECLYRCSTSCPRYHRKWPTPEQYKAEYGEDWPKENAHYNLQEVQEIVEGGKPIMVKRWVPVNIQTVGCITVALVCACTQWGKPPDDFVSEEA
jgi:hypothetical protein